MHIELLVGDIVRQTTVLIAQLSTAAGLRAPLSGIADQVFLDLAGELESQGIRKKVAANMFGLALRTYQLKVRRLREQKDQEPETLWQAMYNQLALSSRTRQELEALFDREDPTLVAATLKDMVQSGVVYCSGRGDGTLFGLTGPQERARIHGQDSALDSMIWYLVATDAARTRTDLVRTLGSSSEAIDQALSHLHADGRIEETEEGYVARRLEIPVGSEKGWEVAVCDHYRAVTSAIASKVAKSARETSGIGGGTVSYRLTADHPLRSEVLAQLEEIRARANELWKRVADYNDEHGVQGPYSRVTFYFGQNVMEQETSCSEDENQDELRTPHER